MSVTFLQPAPAAPKVRELRKEPRFKLPARLVIDGVDIEVTDWSRSGVGFVIRGAEVDAGDRFAADLVFDMPGASLATALDVEIKHYDAKSGRGGLSFQLRDRQGNSAIDDIIEDYLAGKIKVKDGMLTKSETARIAPRLSANTARKPSGIAETTRRLFGLGLFTVAGGAALFYLGTSIYDRLFVFEAASAQVAFDTIDQTSPIAGTLTAVAKPGPVASGAVLFDVVDADGATTEVASPCNCEVATGGREYGAFVSAGSTVVKLVRSDSTPKVLVGVAFPDLRRVYEGAAIDIRFLDGEQIHGARVLAIRSLGGQQSGLVSIEVDPGRQLKAAQFGEPVYARFDTAPWRLNERLPVTGGQS